MNKLIKEVILWVIILLPIIYLWRMWGELPQSVPTHFNIKGEADDWSDRTFLIYIPCMLGICIYLLFLIIPKIDPKNKIGQMGDKFYMIRFITTVFICALSLYVLNLSKTGDVQGTNFIMLLTGAFFAGLGNYMQTVRPNYFVGIRTPWTLENEEVWKSTHKLGGKLWMAGGLLIVVLSLLIHNQRLLQSMFLGIVLGVMAIVPIVYSYMEFKRIKSQASE